MSATDRFLASTRGRILARLMGDPGTVAELAEEFEISTSAVRQHLNGLERDGYVERYRIRHTVSRPAAMYRATPDGEALFPKAYEPVLGLVADQVVDELRPYVPEFFGNVGRRLASEHEPPEHATREERVEAAVRVLTDLGALLETHDFGNGVYRLDGKGCPLSGVVREHPEFCDMIAVMLETMIVLPVQTCCRNDAESPSCRFLIGQETRAEPGSPGRAGQR